MFEPGQECVYLPPTGNGAKVCVLAMLTEKIAEVVVLSTGFVMGVHVIDLTPAA